MLFNQLLTVPTNGKRQNQIIEPLFRFDFEDRAPTTFRLVRLRDQGRRRDLNGAESTFQAVGKYMMTLCPLVGHQGFDG